MLECQTLCTDPKRNLYVPQGFHSQMPVVGKLKFYCRISISIKPRVAPKLVKSFADELAQTVYAPVNMPSSMWNFLHELKKWRHLLCTKVGNILSSRIIDHWVFLPILSKCFQRIWNGCVFRYTFSILLCDFCKRYVCHHVLTQSTENSRQAFDKGRLVGFILLNLSKAFDCLPHRLILCKLNACGISYDACNLIKSYLCRRLQRVKVVAKLSGVLFDDNLSFDEHVSNLKAALQTNAFRRIENIFQINITLTYIRLSYPLISTIVILCYIFATIVTPTT